MGDGSSDKASIFQQQFHWREWVASGTAEMIAILLRGCGARADTKSPGIVSALVNHKFKNSHPMVS